MPLGLKVETHLDERSSEQAANEAVRVFGAAGARARTEFGNEFGNGIGTHARNAADQFGAAFSSALQAHGRTAGQGLVAELTSSLAGLHPLLGTVGSHFRDVSIEAAGMGSGISAAGVLAAGAL